MRLRRIHRDSRDSPKSIDTETFPSSAKDGCWALNGLGPRAEVTDIGTERSGPIAVDGACIGDANMLYGLVTDPGGGEPGREGAIAPLGYMPGGGEPCVWYGCFSHPFW